MATLEMQTPHHRPTPSTSRHSTSSSSLPPAPCSPTIIRTPDFILLPSVPTHEPEDNLPSPHALQHQFALAAFSHAQATRSRQQNSLQASCSDEARKSTTSHTHASNMQNLHDNDEVEEIVEPEPQSSLDWDPAATHDALRDIRNQQLESLQAIIHSIAESHFECASSSVAPDSEVTQILDDLFASLRRIGGHNAPLSPTFTRSSAGAHAFTQMSDVDRLVLLVDTLTLAKRNVDHASQAPLLANLTTLTYALMESERRMARAAIESPPRTPRTLSWSDPSHRRRSSLQPAQHSPQSSTHMSGSRGSWSSFNSYGSLPTSEEAAFAVDPDSRSKEHASAAKLKRFDLSAEAGLLFAVPEQQHIDHAIFDMATIRQSSNAVNSSSSTTFSIDTLYAPPSAAHIVTPQSPPSDHASRAASIGERSDSTALPNRKRFSVQTDSAASTLLPGYDAVSLDSADNKMAHVQQVDSPESDDLPQYHATSTFSADVKTAKLLDAPTLLERRRAKLAAQHSAYAARTPQDLAMVQSSIDRLSTVMPQLDNQRVLSPEEQREAKLHQMIGRLNECNAKRLDDQRSNPPSFKPSRPAPLPQISTKPVPALPAAIRMQASSRTASVAEPEEQVPKTPTTPLSAHSSSASSRRSSLLTGAFGRKLSIASIGNAIRRASIYDTTKVKPKDTSNEAIVSPTQGSNNTVRRRAATQDSRTKYDIANELSSVFNDGKPRKTSAGNDVASAAKFATQTGFRAMDFADDTPRGRVEYMNPRSDIEMEDDCLLDDYSFAAIDTHTSNHSKSIVPDSPLRSPMSWVSSSDGASLSSRRSSHLTSSNPATPTWPKSPLTPISPVASKKGASSTNGKATVTFAESTLLQPLVGRSSSTSLQSQLRYENHYQSATSSALHPRKYHLSDAQADPRELEIVCASSITSAIATTTTTAATAVLEDANRRHDLMVYAVNVPDYSHLAASLVGKSSKGNAADTNPCPRPVVSAISSPHQSRRDVQIKVDVEYLVEVQHSLGHISVLFWSSEQRKGMGSVELKYELVKDDDDDCDQGEKSRILLHISPVEPTNVSVCIGANMCDKSSEINSSGRISASGNDGGRDDQVKCKRDQDDENVGVKSSGDGGGFQILLPAAVVMDAQQHFGSMRLNLDGSVCRLKLGLTEFERRAGVEESRGEGMANFPLSAFELSSCSIQGFCCSVCQKDSKPIRTGNVKIKRHDAVVVKLGKRSVNWKALPSEGWEELVDAWMCHGDQKLNRNLTETAVRFSSRLEHVQTCIITNKDGTVKNGESNKELISPTITIWVGDTYMLLPNNVFDPSLVDFCPGQNGHKTVICQRCHSVLGEIMTSNSNEDGDGEMSWMTVKLSKYLVEPLYNANNDNKDDDDNVSMELVGRDENNWLGILLSEMQHQAALHGTRRFHLQPCRSSSAVVDQEIDKVGMLEMWLFSKARFITSLDRQWSILHPSSGFGGGVVGKVNIEDGKIWKGYRVLYRHVSGVDRKKEEEKEGQGEGGGGESIEKILVPNKVYEWVKDGLWESNTSLPQELKTIVAGWNCAYLARMG